MRLQRVKYLSCLLCWGFISYKNSIRTRFCDHIPNEHNVKFNSDVNLAISVMTAKEKQHIIQCAMTRLNEISSNQITVSGESLLPNLLDTDSESFHGFTDTEIWSALRSLRGRAAVLEDSDTESFHGFTDTEIRSALGSFRGRADAETDVIEAGAEEVNIIDEESWTLEFVRPDIDMVTVKGCLVKARYECQDASIAYFPNVEATSNGIERRCY